MDRTVAEFSRLDAAFNNAGVMAHVTPIADSTRDDWDRVIERRDAASAESSGGGSSV